MASKVDDKKETEMELQLKSEEMLTFKVNKDVAMQSALIKTMWVAGEQTEIPLPNIRNFILDKVIRYMQYHHTNPAKEIEKPLKSANMREVCVSACSGEWDPHGMFRSCPHGMPTLWM